MRCIDEVPAGGLKGKRVLLRVDFNLPINDNGEAADLFRAKKGWASVQYLAQRGSKVIVLSHLTSNPRNPTESMTPIAQALKGEYALFFVSDVVGPMARQAIDAMKDGEIVLLENVRRDPREIENDEGFARELASLADIYVNDSFAVDHRKHASLVIVPTLLPSYAGLLVRDEVQHLDAARAPQSPSFAILGGAKFESKAPLIRALLSSYDHLLICGAIANDVFKARGLAVGRSLISKELPGEDVLGNSHLLAPIDVTVENSAGQAKVKRPEDVEPDDKIVDLGPDTVALIAPHIAAAKSILWSGPTGMYENGYIHYTQAIAELISKSEAKKVIGGGDTIAAIEKTGVPQENLGFLSTGGGAMLEYLLKGTLPGIEVLK